MPPCGNCQEWVRIRLPQNTWFFWLSKMMPTLGRKPSRSSIIKPQILKLSSLCTPSRGGAIGSAAAKTSRHTYDESLPVPYFDAKGSARRRGSDQPQADDARGHDQEAR